MTLRSCRFPGSPRVFDGLDLRPARRQSRRPIDDEETVGFVQPDARETVEDAHRPAVPRAVERELFNSVCVKVLACQSLRWRKQCMAIRAACTPRRGPAAQAHVAVTAEWQVRALPANVRVRGRTSSQRRTGCRLECRCQSGLAASEAEFRRRTGDARLRPALGAWPPSVGPCFACHVARPSHHAVHLQPSRCVPPLSPFVDDGPALENSI